ncbi:conserved hypothetical protein [Renibacterium salmoninarum ATCC 33209]|uniref:Adenylate kinase n=1 Tax=Renibacterium salmoninarum (strain ATCC 33209 / DSM 20767 / JCM 11484 / NBRC 15589 / NCIMB 2235) TaxID=288705 RepID=A9WTA0_RENSM|nr:hypothetical protein [Renibacterium salmoninarum]ABY24038.1 conserved hypothetical protein [Renibacterium salmoninarum ATCC 33209]
MTDREPSNTRNILPHEASRVLIYGVTGSGKSTLAIVLSKISGIEAHLVDEEFGWLPNWTSRPPVEIRELVAPVVAGDAWIFDSAYATFRDLVTPRAQLILGLDYSRARTLAQLLRRTVKRIISKEPVCNGNIETWRSLLSKDSIVAWYFKSFNRKRSTMRQLAKTASIVPRVLLFKNPRQTADWLNSLKAAAESRNR